MRKCRNTNKIGEDPHLNAHCAVIEKYDFIIFNSLKSYLSYMTLLIYVIFFKIVYFDNFSTKFHYFGKKKKP